MYVTFVIGAQELESESVTVQQQDPVVSFNSLLFSWLLILPKI